MSAVKTKMAQEQVRGIMTAQTLKAKPTVHKLHKKAIQMRIGSKMLSAGRRSGTAAKSQSWALAT